MTEQDLERILNIPLFDALTREECEKIAEGLRFHTYKRNDYVFRSGDQADRLYIVIRGRMKIFRALPDGREQVLYLYNEDDFVGGFNLMKKTKYIYNAQVLCESEIATLDKDSFDAIVLKNPAMLLKILEKSYERVRWAEGLLDRLVSNSTDARVASLILDLVRDYGIVSGKFLKLVLPMNREDLGSFCGMTRETFTRKLIDFQKQEIVRMDSQRDMVILDPDRLRLIAGSEDTGVFS
ncbi:MAG: Crp/Fnr family transcriptional regulator [Eubacteriales bacterium]|nr:Crp/Fnr family transcriptional regulator [Eubacteriales bacterium]